MSDFISNLPGNGLPVHNQRSEFFAQLDRFNYRVFGAADGTEFWTFCPNHEVDGHHDPSLHITVDKNDGVKTCCFTCDRRSFFVQIITGNLVECTATYRAKPGNTMTGANARRSVWEIRDDASYRQWCQQVSQVGFPYEEVAYEYGHNAEFLKVRWSDKQFTWLRRRYDGSYVRGLDGAGPRIPLYGAPSLAPDGLVYAVEGEKDVENLRNRGLAAISYVYSGEPESRFEILTGRDVVILHDNDAAGRSWERRALAAISRYAKSVRLLPSFSTTEDDGYDVSDWLDEGHAADELLAMVEGVEPAEPAAPEDEFTEPENVDPADTWGEVDLSRYLDNPVVDPPTLLDRSDGEHLLYAGHKAWVFGEPGAGKTWLAALASKQEIKRGNHVVWFDFESQGHTAVARLITLGCTKEEIREFFHLVEPETAYVEDVARQHLNKLLRHRPTVVIFDAANGVLTLQGGKLNDAEPIMRFDTMLLVPFCRVGAAVMVIDHVAKNADSRGLWPLNSGAKKAICSVAYAIATRSQFRPDRDGAAMVTVAKDRNGRAPGEVGKPAGYLVVNNGEFSIEPGLDLAAMRQEAIGGDEVVRTLVEKEPGEHSVYSLATKLEKEAGQSTSSWQRRINALVKNGDVEKSDKGKLVPASEERAA